MFDLEMRDALLAEVISIHPLPWHLDFDWGHEVIDAKDQRVFLMRTREQAQGLVKLSEEYARQQEELTNLLKEDYLWIE
jgi:hypothetical protein